MGLRNSLPEGTTVLKVLGGGAALLGVSLSIALSYFQTSLIYPANMPEGSRTNVPKPDEFGMPYENVDLVTPDGIRIKAYLIQQDEPSNRPTVLMLHANAGNVGHRLPLAKVFYREMRCNVFALSYRGYGLSEGSPNEKGIKLDAQTALDYILSHPKLEKTAIFAYGQSIGGAVAIHLAAQNANRIHGLIVENTFTSLPRLIPSVLGNWVTPFLYIPGLLTQFWRSHDSINKLPAQFPVLFLSGLRDELVVPPHMAHLYVLCSSQNKHWRDYKMGTHNDTCMRPGYWEDVAEFVRNQTSGKNPEMVESKQISSPSSATSESANDSMTDSYEFVNKEVSDEKLGALSVDPVHAAAQQAKDKIREKL